jgi:predicted alpha/beta hydrolase family esterase
MKNAIILHGRPSKAEYYGEQFPSMSNSHWLPWLQSQLLKNDIPAATPDIPFAFEPRWDLWVKEVERFEMGPETVLVGHSTGSGFWIKYLSLHKNLKVGKVILVAPWIDPDGDETEGFFDDYQMEPNLAKRTKGLVIFNSDNDMGNVLKSVAIIREKIKDVEYREFHKYGHFTHKSMPDDKFPELLEECLSS